MSQNSQSLLLFFANPQLRARSERLLETLKDVDPDSSEPAVVEAGDAFATQLATCWQEEWFNTTYECHADCLKLDYDSRSAEGVPLALLHAWFEQGLTAAVLEIFFDQVGELKRYHFVDDALVSKSVLDEAYPQWAESIAERLPLQPEDEVNDDYCVSPSSPIALTSWICDEQERLEKAQALVAEITNFTQLAAETGTPALSLMRSALVMRCLLKGAFHALLFTLIMVLLFQGMWLWIVMGLLLLVALPLIYGWRLLKGIGGDEGVADAD